MNNAPGLETVSVVIPAKNEDRTIAGVVQGALATPGVSQVLVVDDGSTDSTASVAEAAGAEVLRHRYSRGNGAAIKAGARVATGDILVCMDGDGQHDPADIPKLLARLNEGHDLVVGARQSKRDQASTSRWAANMLYNRLASLLVDRPVDDLTSGFRAMRLPLFREILPLLPNGFSYPTTTTMTFFRAGHSVCFEPIAVASRHSDAPSHIRPLRDGFRFLTIIFKVVSLYSPLKIFMPSSLLLFLGGLCYYAYTYTTDGRFTNMGMLLLLAALITFLFGLLAEQLTTLMYLKTSNNTDDWSRTLSAQKNQPPGTKAP